MRAVYFILILAILNICPALGQNKRPIDSTLFGTWPSLTNPIISPNGKIVSYIVRNQPIGLSTLVLKNVITGWERSIVSNKDFFWDVQLDNDLAIFRKGSDSMGVARINKDIKYFVGYSKIEKPNGKLIGLKDGVLMDMSGTLQVLAKNVKAYFPGRTNETLVLIKDKLQGVNDTLQILSLTSRRIHELSKVPIEGEVVFSKNRRKAAFIRHSGNLNARLIEVWDLMTYSNITIENQYSDKYTILGLTGFSENNSSLFLTLVESTERRYFPDNIDLTIWNYKDQTLPYVKKGNLNRRQIPAIVSLSKGRIVYSLKENESYAFGIEHTKNCMIITKTEGDCSFLETWNTSCRKSYYRLSLIDGSKIKLDQLDGKIWDNEISLSPNERFLILYDALSQSFSSYDMQSKVLRNLTDIVYAKFNIENLRLKTKGYNMMRSRGLVGWMNSSHVLIYDRFDIWKFDLIGQNQPQNITNGFGALSNLEFSLDPEPSAKIFKEGDPLLLIALDLNNMDNGFYQHKIGSNRNPEKLTMGPYLFRVNRNPQDQGLWPLKAGKSDVYLVRRSSVNSFPNYFLTRDFIHFQSITSFRPEEPYNWYSSELHTYSTVDGEKLKGILFKPACFDSSKKYPVIFNYYESLSRGKNEYREPNSLCNGCQINIPLMTSRGYLVFMPDMQYKLDSTGYYALQALNAAVDHLSQFSWLDTTKMGIQGCSWGGYETNYIVAHSKKFKAACSASGFSDVMGWAAINYKNTYSSFSYQQIRMATLPWENPQIMLENSPIFRTDDIETPMLFMHTTNDSAVPFNLGAAQFMSLRKLNKPAWLLEYGGTANHGIWNSNQANDFSKRMIEFFDHYLKNKPAPDWMQHEIKPQLAY